MFTLVWAVRCGAQTTADPRAPEPGTCKGSSSISSVTVDMSRGTQPAGNQRYGVQSHRHGLRVRSPDPQYEWHVQANGCRRDPALAI